MRWDTASFSIGKRIMVQCPLFSVEMKDRSSKDLLMELMDKIEQKIKAIAYFGFR